MCSGISLILSAIIIPSAVCVLRNNDLMLSISYFFFLIAGGPYLGLGFVYSVR